MNEIVYNVHKFQYFKIIKLLNYLFQLNEFKWDVNLMQWIKMNGLRGTWLRLGID